MTVLYDLCEESGYSITRWEFQMKTIVFPLEQCSDCGRRYGGGIAESRSDQRTSASRSGFSHVISIYLDCIP